MWQFCGKWVCEGGEAGKRTGLKIQYFQQFAGSTPAPRTTLKGLKIPGVSTPPVDIIHKCNSFKRLSTLVFLCLWKSTYGSLSRLR